MDLFIQILLRIVISGSLFLLISLGFSLVYSATKFFLIAHAIILTSAAYFTFLFSRQMALAIWVAVPLAIVCATGVGLLTEAVLYKPLRRRGASSMVLMIASVGLYTVLQNVISMVWGNDTRSIRFWDVKVGREFMGAYIMNIQIVTIVVCLVLFVACALFMKYSRIGRNIRAVASNPELANIMGISSDRTILWAFGIGSALAAVAGILIAFDTDMTPTMGFRWLLYGVVAFHRFRADTRSTRRLFMLRTSGACAVWRL